MTKPFGVQIGELSAHHINRETIKRPGEEAKILGEVTLTLLCSAFSIPAYLVEKKDVLDKPKTQDAIIAMGKQIVAILDADESIHLPKLKP